VTLLRLVDICKAHKGCTYSVTQDKELTGTPAYVLSTFKTYEEKVSALKPQTVRRYVQKHRKELHDPKYALGIWLDKNTYYLDVVTLLPKNQGLRQADVQECAVKFQQQAAYDLEKQELISAAGYQNGGHCPLAQNEN
jgi:hypothetical protein